MPEKKIDLRSDTATLPTDEMRQAMARAPVGDDALGEDPTVNRLQELAAEKMGMEAALYVPSGSMGNRCGLTAHTSPGDAVFFEAKAHGSVRQVETYAGAKVYPVAAELGTITPEQLREAMDSARADAARPGVLSVENTHNFSGGSPWTPAALEALSTTAREHGLKVHMDGARIFNAVVARGVDVTDYTRHVDSVMFCASKGLSAPVGSLLCGSRDFIDRARNVRKDLGGAMRQAGVIAAAAMVSLEKMVTRLAEDHDNARLLYERLEPIAGIKAEQPPTPTNFVMVDVEELGWKAEDLIEKWKACGVLGHPWTPTQIRLVIHRHITPEDVDYVAEVTRRLVEGSAA